MKKQILIALGITSIVAVSLIVLLTDSSKTKTHWGYTGNEAPKYWGSLNEKFKTCSEGQMQTPIDVIPTEDKDITPLVFNYNTTSTSVIDNGHTVQVNIANGSSVTIDGEAYSLKQFHFHTPSENNIKGQQYPFEAHFVHATDDGKLAVVAVMFDDSTDTTNPMLAKIWNKFPLNRGDKVDFKLSADDINSIMPENKDYYKFMGSLTTPPCTEGVKWNVLKTAVSISKEQVKKFFDIYGHTNNREIQATNNRIITE